MTLLAPPVDRVLGPLPGNEGEVVYDSWLMARPVLLCDVLERGLPAVRATVASEA